jgi:hypothetical protein
MQQAALQIGMGEPRIELNGFVVVWIQRDPEMQQLFTRAAGTAVFSEHRALGP